MFQSGCRLWPAEYRIRELPWSVEIYVQCLAKSEEKIKDHLILPYDTDFVFKCPVCLNETETYNQDIMNYLWRFVPTDETKIYNIVPKRKIVKIDQLGSLFLTGIKRSGTYYCIHNDILAEYYVTIVNEEILRKRESDTYQISYWKKSIKIDNFNTDLILLNLNNSLHIENCPVNTFIHSVFICFATMDIQDTLKADTILSYKIYKYSKISCWDPNIQPYLIEINSPKIVQIMRECPYYKKVFKKPEKSSLNSLRKVVQRTMIIKKSIGSSVTLSCFWFLPS